VYIRWPRGIGRRRDDRDLLLLTLMVPPGRPGWPLRSESLHRKDTTSGRQAGRMPATMAGPRGAGDR
jgi:hypothetical protein